MKDDKVKWSTTKLTAIGSLGAATAVLSLAGAAINAISGVSGFGAIINIFVYCMMFALCCLIFDKFGSATIMGLVFGIIAIPIPVIGPPGFLPKILITVVYGFAADIVYTLLKRNKKIASIGVGLAVWVHPLLFIPIGMYFSITSIHKLADIIFSPPAILFGSAYMSFSGYVGYLIYNKLKNTAVVKRIQGIK